MKILKAEVWDRMQFLFRNYYDRTMHAALCYDKVIELEKLKQVIKYMVDNIPVLHSTFKNNPIKPYWKVNEDCSIDEIVTDVKVAEADLWNNIYGFLEHCMDYKAKVQIRVRVFYTESGSTIAITFNHMCFDGGDVKYFLNKMCENYVALEEGKPFVPIKHGSRACDAIYDDLSAEDAKIARKLYKNISAVHDSHTFPLSKPTADDKLTIVARQLDSDLFNNFRAIGKKMGLTVNDLMLGVYIHSLYEFANWDRSKRLAIPCMVDLRRYLKDGGASLGFTNHTGFMIGSVESCTDDINETMQAVAKCNKKNKDDKFLGLYSIPLLKLAYNIFPQRLAEVAIKIGYDNPLIGMSNIGQIGHELDMGNITLVDGFMTGAIKYKPYMQLALISVLGKMKLSICVRGNAQDRTIINNFFDIFETNIKKFVAKNS